MGLPPCRYASTSVESGRSVCQCPGTRATPHRKKIVPKPTAGMYQGDHDSRPFLVTVRQFSTGQAATHDMHPVHSGVRTEVFLWTVISTGQAWVHALQSVQLSASRTTRCGEAQLTSPSRAPYGHRYRHQECLMTTESAARTIRVIAVVREMSAKKRSIFEIGRASCRERV